MSPLNDGSSRLWRFVFRLLMVLMIALCFVVIAKVHLMERKLDALATSQVLTNNSIQAMRDAQAAALRQLLAASEKRTKDEADMAAELLTGQLLLSLSVEVSLDEFTGKAEQRTKQNNRDADISERTAVDFKNQLDGFQVWLSQEITKLQTVTQATHAKLSQKIVTTSEIAPVYRQNRLLKKKTQQLQQQKEPSFKLGPIQF